MKCHSVEIRMQCNQIQHETTNVGFNLVCVFRDWKGSLESLFAGIKHLQCKIVTSGFFEFAGMKIGDYIY